MHLREAGSLSTGRLSIIYPRLNKPFLQANGLCELAGSNSLKLRQSAIKPVCTGSDCQWRDVQRDDFACSLGVWKRAKKRVSGPERGVGERVTRLLNVNGAY